MVRSHCSRVGLYETAVLIQRGHLDTDMPTGRCHVKMKAYIRLG